MNQDMTEPCPCGGLLSMDEALSWDDGDYIYEIWLCDSCSLILEFSGDHPEGKEIHNLEIKPNPNA
jgi:hypothetical protein